MRILKVLGIVILFLMTIFSAYSTTLTNGLDVYINFDGDTYTDETGNYTFTNTGSVTGEGIIGDGRFFDGLNDDIVSTANTHFASNEPFSFQTWIKTNNSGDNWAGNRDSPSHQGWNILSGGTGKLQFTITNVWSSDALAISTNTDYSDWTWKHVVVTYDGSKA